MKWEHRRLLCLLACTALRLGRFRKTTENKKAAVPKTPKRECSPQVEERDAARSMPVVSHFTNHDDCRLHNIQFLVQPCLLTQYYYSSWRRSYHRLCCSLRGPQARGKGCPALRIPRILLFLAIMMGQIFLHRLLRLKIGCILSCIFTSPATVV